VRAVADAEVAVSFVVASLREAALLAPKKRADFHVLRGRVLDGASRPRADWYVYGSLAGSALAAPQFISAWTGGDGRYVLYVPSGTLHLGAARSFPPASIGPVLRVVEVAGDAAELDIVVGDPPAPRSGG
jgi:hypothetical protein